MTRIPAYFVGSILAAGSIACLIRHIGWRTDGEVRWRRMWRRRARRTARGTEWR